MKAVKILHTKEVTGDEIVEIKIWQVPKSADKPYGVKYSIAYGKGMGSDLDYRICLTRGKRGQAAFREG